MEAYLNFVYIMSFDFWKILVMKAFSVAVMGKNGYEK